MTAISLSEEPVLLSLQHENEKKLQSLNLNGSDMENKFVIESEATVCDGRREGEITVNSIARPALPKGFSETLTSRSDDNYYMNHKNRGYCVIFNHHIFDKHTGLNERSGTNKDRDAVQGLFSALGFNVQTCDDFNVKEIHEQLDYFAHKVDHTDNDCFVIVFMSHGEDGCLYGKDSTFPSDKIYSSFTADSCPSLAGKPKMFFIQACRGEGLDNGVTLVQRSRDETDTGSFAMYKIPAHSDFLICWSTVPDFRYLLTITTANESKRILGRLSPIELDKVHYCSNSSNRGKSDESGLDVSIEGICNTGSSSSDTFLDTDDHTFDCREGHFSWRNTTNGSWFIQSLVKVFFAEAATNDVLSMMTNVNRHMILNFESNCPSVKDMHKKKQTACTINSLMRKIYIVPKCQ